MKKLLILLCIFCALPVLADENPAGAPAQTANDNRATVAIQKQPAADSQTQEAKQNKWCIIIQVNGKVKENNEK